MTNPYAPAVAQSAATPAERLHRRASLSLVVLLFVALPLSTGAGNLAAVLLILLLPLRWRAFVAALRAYPWWLIAVVLAPLAAALLAAPAALQEGISPVRALGLHRKELLFIALLAVFAMYPARRPALWGLGISAFAAALLSIAFWWSGFGIKHGTYDPIHPIGMNRTFQDFILGAISIGLLRLAWQRDTPLSPRVRRLVTFAVAVCLFSVVFVVTGRTGQLATLLMALWLILIGLSGRRRVLLLAGIALVVALGVALSPQVRDRYGAIASDIERFRNGDPLTSVGLRLDYWTHTWQLIRARPWFGYGTGSFQPVYEGFLGIDDSSPRSAPHPHSDPLYYWMERGLPGLLSFVIVFIGLLKMSGRLAEPHRNLLRALIAGFLFCSLANAFFRDWASGAFLFAAAALLCSTSVRRP